MKKTSIPLIAMAIFSILILINLDIMPAYADTITYYELVANSGQFCLNNGQLIFFGELPVDTSSALYGKVINGITLSMSKSGSPTGNYIVGVWSNTTAPNASNPIYTISTNSSASLTNVITQYTFTNLTGSHAMGLNEVIGVFFTGGSAGNAVCIRMNVYASAAASYDARHSVANTYASSWNIGTNQLRDMTATIFFTTSAIPPQNIISGVDCSLPENENKLICALADIPNSTLASDYVIGSTEEQTGLLGIGCRVGLVDCISNPDVKTNGLGILMFVTSIFVVVGMFMTTQGAEKTFKIPTMIWAIIIIALSAFFTVTNIIDPIFLIVSIIGLIALASPRLVSMFGGGANTFGSGSTE